MTDIKFSRFDCQDGRLSFVAEQGELAHSLWFQLPRDYEPDEQLIALALTTMIGAKYDRVELDLALTAETRASFSQLCSCIVESKIAPAQLKGPSGNMTALNFSGGFDSLAAKALLPRDTVLIALDFGGSFERETRFFRKFEPVIVGTNFRSEGFAANSWSFMGVGTILLKDYLGLRVYSFGSILEASPYNFSNGLRFRNAANPWFAAAGLEQVNPVLGLTEVGTALLLLEYSPEHIRDSLLSLAAPHTEKYARKIILLYLASRRAGRETGRAVLESLPDRSTPFLKFGTSFASDFLIFYILKFGGPDLANRLVGDIPESVIEVANQCSLSFYERLNPDFYNDLPTPHQVRILNNCLEAGIGIYDQNDWIEFAAVREILGNYHGIPVA